MSDTWPARVNSATGTRDPEFADQWYDRFGGLTQVRGTVGHYQAASKGRRCDTTPPCRELSHSRTKVCGVSRLRLLRDALSCGQVLGKPTVCVLNFDVGQAWARRLRQDEHHKPAVQHYDRRQKKQWESRQSGLWPRLVYVIVYPGHAAVTADNDPRMAWELLSSNAKSSTFTTATGPGAPRA